MVQHKNPRHQAGASQPLFGSPRTESRHAAKGNQAVDTLFYNLHDPAALRPAAPKRHAIQVRLYAEDPGKQFQLATELPRPPRYSKH